MRKQFLITGLCVFLAAGSVISGCGKHEGLYAGNEIGFKYEDENRKKIDDAVKIKDEYTDQIIQLLEKIEPGCRIVSAEETGEIDGGYLIEIKTESGNEYTVNTATDGMIGNITDKKTGKMLYPSDSLPEEEDDAEGTEAAEGEAPAESEADVVTEADTADADVKESEGGEDNA